VRTRRMRSSYPVRGERGPHCPEGRGRRSVGYIPDYDRASVRFYASIIYFLGTIELGGVADLGTKMLPLAGVPGLSQGNVTNCWRLPNIAGGVLGKSFSSTICFLGTIELGGVADLGTKMLPLAGVPGFNHGNVTHCVIKIVLSCFNYNNFLKLTIITLITLIKNNTSDTNCRFGVTNKKIVTFLYFLFVTPLILVASLPFLLFWFRGLG
jgi:hypothetical protein